MSASFHPISYFTALARARQLLPQGKELLDHGALVDPDTIAEAARLCGLPVEWSAFQPPNLADFERHLGDAAGLVYVIGFSSQQDAVLTLEGPCNRLESLEGNIRPLGADVTLIHTALPSIGLVHHENVYTTLHCHSASSAAEHPALLERQLSSKLEERRTHIASEMPPDLLERLEEVAEGGAQKIAAIRFLISETGCSLRDAHAKVSCLWPWWPCGSPRQAHA